MRTDEFLTCFYTLLYNNTYLGTTWATAKVAVKGSQATVYLDDKEITQLSPYHPAKGSFGGVVVANGYTNTAAFRNLKLENLGKI